MKRPKPLLSPSIVNPPAVVPSISKLLAYAPSCPFRPGLSGGKMLLPSVIVLLAGKLKLIVTVCPLRFRALAWWMQYRRSPLLPEPTPRPNEFASVVAITVNVFWARADPLAASQRIIAAIQQARRHMDILHGRGRCVG